MKATVETWKDINGVQHFHVWSSDGWNSTTTDPWAWVVRVRMTTDEEWNNVSLMPNRNAEDAKAAWKTSCLYGEAWAKKGYMVRIDPVHYLVEDN